MRDALEAHTLTAAEGPPAPAAYLVSGQRPILTASPRGARDRGRGSGRGSGSGSGSGGGGSGGDLLVLGRRGTRASGG